MYTRFFRPLYLVIALLFVTSAGCDSNESVDETAPEVFPAAAFTMDTNLFNQNLAPKQAAGINFTAAALRVWPVSLGLSVYLVIPTALTASALQAEPTSDDGSWVWAASATANGATASYSLSGTRRDGGTDWSMRVTMTTGGESLDNFEVFTGRTEDNGNSGSWELYFPEDGERTNVLSAAYEIESETSKSITFSIPTTSDTNAGDSVTYSENGDERSFDWQQLSAGFEHLITWSDVDGSGAITATNFSSGATSCWDANLNDTTCPE